MAPRSQEKESSGDFETSETENNTVGNPIAGTSKFPRLQSGNLDEIKMSRREDIMSNLTKF